MKTLLRSFAGGEITPELFGRFELTKYQTGLRRARNFITLPHGPAVRRPGTKYVLQAKDSTRRVRLIPFSFSADETLVLEFGHLYVRFHTNGQTVLGNPVAVTSVVGNTVNTAAPHSFPPGGQVNVGGAFFLVTPTGGSSFTTTGLRGEPAAPPPGSTTASLVFVHTTPYTESDLFDLHYAQSNDVLTLVHPNHPARTFARTGPLTWVLTDISFAPGLATPGGVGVAPTIAVSTNLSPQGYAVTALAADGVTESLPSAVVTTSNNLTLAGNYNTISWSAVGGAARYNIYKRRGGVLAYMGQTTGLSTIDDNITADSTKVPPENLYNFNNAAGEYPSAISYHEQRKWFGGTRNNPQTVYATRNGTENNLTSSLPSQADDGIRYRLAAQQQNQIRHLVPLSDLMALTASAEWRIFSDNEPSITPTSFTAKPMGYSGANNVQPIVTSGSILYVQAQGARLRELAYNETSYRSVDMSIMAPHLFNGFQVVDLAYARAPEQLCWAVRDDGKMLGLTYVPEQQVYGWHQHDTDGFFESACTVAEGAEDALYVVVRRTIDGTQVRYIERLQSRLFGAQANAQFVDACLTYDGAPTTTISGLHHLEGKTVQILADGAVHPQREVVNGQITLLHAASKVHIGLGYVSDFITLPLAMEGMQAAGQGTYKNVLRAHLRVTDTSLFKVGTTFEKLTPNRSRAVSDPYDSAPALKTGEYNVQIDGDWNTDASVCVRQDQPLPLTITALTLDVEFGD